MSSKGKSPYVRKGKTPYPYQFRRCSHNTLVEQSVATKTRDGEHYTWRGTVCTVCNIIVPVFKSEAA